MSQILDAIDKADQLRKQKEQANLNQKDALAYIVHVPDRSSKKLLWLWIFIILCCLITVIALVYRSTILAQNIADNHTSVSKKPKNTINMQSEPVIPADKPMANQQQSRFKTSPQANNSKLNKIEKMKSTDPLTPDKSKGSSSLSDIRIELPEVLPVNSSTSSSNVKVVIDLPQHKPKTNVSRETASRKITLEKRKTNKTAGIRDKNFITKIADSNAKYDSSETSVNKNDASSNTTRFPFRINVLMFDDDISKRYVIIQGQRLRTGDRVPNTNFRLSVIRRDGVIVDSDQGAMFVKSL